MYEKIQVWHISQVPGDPFLVEVDNEKEAKLVMDVLAIYDQFQFQNKIKPDFSNAQGVEMLEDGCWTDYYSEDDEDFDDYCEKNKISYVNKLIDKNKIKF